MAIDREHAERLNQSKEESKQQQQQQIYNTNNQPTELTGTLNIPKKAARQKKKNYTFSLHPDVRAEIVKKAQENNYKSSSELLNELFKPQ